MLENKKFKSADGKFEIGIDPDGSYGYRGQVDPLVFPVRLLGRTCKTF